MKKYLLLQIVQVCYRSAWKISRHLLSHPCHIQRIPCNNLHINLISRISPFLHFFFHFPSAGNLWWWKGGWHLTGRNFAVALFVPPWKGVWIISGRSVWEIVFSSFLRENIRETVNCSVWCLHCLSRGGG